MQKMSEKEAIEYMENELKCIQKAPYCDRSCEKCELVKEEIPLVTSYQVAIQALEEIQQYRAIGTVEEINEMMANGWFTGAELAELAFMQSELKKYKSIGTVKECREAVERIRPKKPDLWVTDIQTVNLYMIYGIARIVARVMKLTVSNMNVVPNVVRVSTGNVWRNDMERLSIDEAIAHAREVANTRTDLCDECRAEHRQLAEWLEQLKTYKDLEEQGRLQILPCAVGDYAWDLISHHRFEVVSIELHLTGLVMFRCGNKGTDDYASFSLEDIGDTWMLTEPKETDYWHPAKANTQAAMEKMKGEEHEK